MFLEEVRVYYTVYGGSGYIIIAIRRLYFYGGENFIGIFIIKKVVKLFVTIFFERN